MKLDLRSSRYSATTTAIANFHLVDLHTAPTETAGTNSKHHASHVMLAGAASMSTFDGRLSEFPDIRIDYFRVSPNDPVQPLAFFLSHVHSDHLQGLDTCKSPFVYCTPATKQLLLKLEKYPDRMNFARGILEHREKTYAHLKDLLKPIALETPTTLELAPGRSIRVTLYDANHCTGACVFLIEDESHAIMYTGDIRSEQWWVDSLVRQPLLLPYSCRAGEAPIKRLDCIYLDTTFANSLGPYRRFQSKKDGVIELLVAVAKYPADTLFHFNTWTFGYEEVWLALSGYLHSRVHVDAYRYDLYRSLLGAERLQSNQGNQLIGYDVGNHHQAGCLTQSQARIHSCEYGTQCEVFEQDFVRITPIVTRYQGIDVAELGAGGSHGGSQTKHELVADDSHMLQALMAYCRSKLCDQPALLEEMEALLQSQMNAKSSPLPLDTILDDGLEQRTDASHMDNVAFDVLILAMLKANDDKRRAAEEIKSGVGKSIELRPDGLPKCITFPYSRHSSYDELRCVISAFLPNEIYPCTVNQDGWDENNSMEHLFADLYPQGKTFRHDRVMRRLVEQRKQIRDLRRRKSRQQADDTAVLQHKSREQAHVTADLQHKLPASTHQAIVDVGQCRADAASQTAQSIPALLPSRLRNEQAAPHIMKKALQREAFYAASEREGLEWSNVELISTRSHEPEVEL